ncbi:Gfo/Idh/MocA family oxidoreductase [Sinomonas sp. JGH33]|uniref:Gfo/Idh/MocA family oxidoreductase n=1 Tax=Sinomonas terricola TaxID=3110330 RepID=A0ABU5T6B3_9MICC|nr:Gfo/Idh/MocA family oxidoreductase [Sinomonas sp. JGH33]MEA5455199.1 Gfo/Idh/MocA family oxidoreductase [Sinomonas sp. JGH33]
MPRIKSATRIRTAIVGFGVSGGVFHGPLLGANRSYSVEAVVTGNPERVAAARKRFPRAFIVKDYAALLELVDDGTLELDLMVLGTPPALHREQAIAAVERGLHIVVDKPFAPSLEDAQAMTDAAAAAGVVLTVFQNRRWDGDFLTVADLVRAGRLGEVRTFESRFEWWRPEGFGNWRDAAAADDGGGLLTDLGSHLIDQATQLFGQVEDARADLRRHSDGLGGDEDSFAELRHASGVVSRLWMNGLAPARGPRFHVLGSRAGFTSWGLDGQEAALATGADPRKPGYGAVPSREPARLSDGSSAIDVGLLPGDYPAFYRLLADAVHRNGPLPVEPAEALETLRIIRVLHATTPLRSSQKEPANV